MTQSGGVLDVMRRPTRERLAPMELPRYTAARYAAPLREGGSLPAVVETTDGGLWVVKFVGAGQGARALIAEIIVGELARHAGLGVPELGLVEIDASFGRTERDPEIQDLLRASHGTNLGLRYLDGALNYDPLAASDLVDADTAAEIVWLDAFVTNIDRTARNPNMMIQNDDLWLIDHGAALYFHHAWQNVTRDTMTRPFGPISNHVLLPLAGNLLEADERMAARITPETLTRVIEMVPDELLLHAPEGMTPSHPTAEEARRAYVEALEHRLADRAFAEAAAQARRDDQ
jgi:hypothetical protein